MRTEPIGMAVAVLFLLASGQACAGTVGELAEIQAQAILTEAKVRLATAQRQLEGKGETGQVVSAQGQTFAMPVPAAPPTITQRLTSITSFFAIIPRFLPGRNLFADKIAKT